LPTKPPIVPSDGIWPRSFLSLDFVNDGARIAKRFSVFQRVTVIVPPVAPFNLFYKLAERGGDSSRLMRGIPLAPRSRGGSFHF
jgi:hypothetical protein